MEAKEGELLAVFGGSFDPPHLAHVLVAAYVLAAHDVDRLLVAPSYRHPLEKKLETPFADRLRMTELALRDLRRVEVSSIESELGGGGRTLDLLEALSERFPGARLRLVVGTDILAERHRWHRWDRVEALAPPIVVGRQGHSPEAGLPALPEISSTEVRSRLAGNQSVAGIVPRPVVDYIVERGLYRAERP